MYKHLFLLIFILINVVQGYSQSDAQLEEFAKTLTMLSEKAQTENDLTAILNYQNAWLQIKNDLQEIEDESVFLLVSSYFEGVRVANSEIVGIRCFSLEGSAEIVIPNDCGGIVVAGLDGQRTTYMEVGDFLKKFKIPVINANDQALMGNLNLLEDGNTLEIDDNQVLILQQLYQKLGKATFKNAEDGKFSNIDGFKTTKLADLQIYSDAKIKSNLIQSTKTDASSKDGFKNEKLNKQRIKEENKILRSIEKLQKMKSINESGG